MNSASTALTTKKCSQHHEQLLRAGRRRSLRGLPMEGNPFGTDRAAGK